MNTRENNTSSGRVRLSSVMGKYSTRESVVRLGIDILEQLIELRNTGISYVYITPADISVMPSGEFRITSSPEKVHERPGTFSHLYQLYTAPEAYETYGGEETAIYSLGTIMYKLLNGGLEPFRNTLDFDSAASSYKLRMSGIRPSAPKNADALLSAIILKACEFSPSQRYVDAEDMLEELRLLSDGNYQRTPQAPPPKTEVRKKVKKSSFILSGIGLGILVAGIAIFLINLKFNSSYVKAERYLRDGKTENAREIFEDMLWYKDSDEMLYKCDFAEAELLLKDGKIDEALKIFEYLKDKGFDGAKDGYNDAILAKAAELTAMGKTDEALELISTIEDDEIKGTNDQKEETAMKLYEEGKYLEAKNVFLSINDKNMADECDYYIAMDYMDSGDYAKAMALFNALGAFDDSQQLFTSCEEKLAEENEENFPDMMSIGGKYENDDDYYIHFEEEDGKTLCKYNLPFEDGEFFKLENGIHYHSDDIEDWQKQWIYERKSDDEIYVYNYIDGNVYILEKR